MTAGAFVQKDNEKICYAIGFLTTIIFLNFLFGFIVIYITGG